MLTALYFCLYFSLLLQVACDVESVTVDQNTLTSAYDGLTLKVLTNEVQVIIETTAEVAIENVNWHGLTSLNDIDKLVTVAVTEAMEKTFKDSLRNEEIQMNSLSEVDSFMVGLNETSGQSTLFFDEEMYLRDNSDTDGYDFGKIWDTDTIYNFINHTTSQVSWMEEMTYNLGDGLHPLKIIKISRYPQSPYKDQRVHVFMSSWDSSQWMSIKATLRMLNQFLNYDTDINDEIHSLVTRNTLYVIPLPNPQGYTQTVEKNRFWRKNLNPVTDGDFSCVGVNLELNARTTVSKKVTTKECNSQFDGSAPFSELEVSKIVNFATDLIAGTSKPIYWFQFDENYFSVLLQPYAAGEIGAFPPNYTDILDFYKTQKGSIVKDLSLKVPYAFELGQHAFYAVPDSYFLDILIARGITNTFLVGLPLKLQDKLRPVGDIGRAQSEEFSLGLLRAVDRMTIIIDPLTTYGPIITIVIMIVPVLLLIGSLSLIFTMHEDTKRLENERAAVHVDVPYHVKALGAQRQYNTEVIAGKEVRKRTVGADDSNEDRFI